MMALKKKPPMESGAILRTNAGAPQSAINIKHGTKIDSKLLFAGVSDTADFTNDSGGLNGLSLT